MRINGSWLLCPDGALRPVVVAEVRAVDGSWPQVPFLVDTGADRTVLSTNVWVTLALPAMGEGSPLEGVGGRAASVQVETTIRLRQDTGVRAHFNGRFAAFLDPKSLDMSVLGRDILNLFAVIIDRPQDVVCLLAQNHTYEIRQR